MLRLLMTFVLLALCTEAISELVVKSEIFKPLREMLSKIPFLKTLLSCGYCFSVWAAILVICITGFNFKVSSVTPVNYLLTTLAIHRLANIIHNVIDKHTDKFYDMRYATKVADAERE